MDGGREEERIVEVDREEEGEEGRDVGKKRELE